MTADVLAALCSRGYATLRAGTPAAELVTTGGLDGFTTVERLVAQRPDMVEQQPIRPVPGGRSFASSNVLTPLHTDSQDFRGVAPALQVNVCRRAAERGGETTLLDTWALLRRIARDEPPLFDALFTTVRRIPFYFGEVVGPTVARKGGHLVLTHSPIAPRDDVGHALAAWIARAEQLEIALGSGDVLVVDNHRMLHGRRAFEDTRRALWRVLAWLPRPLAAPPDDLWRRSAATPPAEPLPRRVRVVAEMIGGVAPGVLAAREGIAEAELYRWRNAALEAASAALPDEP